MKKVYILILGSRSGQESIKGFSTLEAAEAYFESLPENAHNQYQFDKDNSCVEEVEIDSPNA